MRKILLLLSALLMTSSVIAQDRPSLLHQPLRVQFDSATAGPAVEFHLDARQSAIYHAVIGFRLQPGAPAAALLPVGEKQNGPVSPTILKLPVRLLITRVANGEVLMDSTVEQEALESSNRSELVFSVGQIRLERGEYQVNLSVLRGIDRPEGIDSNFVVYIRRL